MSLGLIASTARGRWMVPQGRTLGNPMTRSSKTAVPETTSIGARLRRLRKQRRLTQSELARQIGIQQSDLSRMEKGEYRVSLDNLFRILAVFDVDVAEFFQHQPAERPAPVQALGQEDMQLMQLLRQLSPEGRREVHEYVEFKLRREQIERRAREARSEREVGS